MSVETDLIGARLDAAVELAIFGRAATAFPIGAVREGGQIVARYSEDMNAAWYVVHELRKRGFDFVLSAAGKDLWFCSFAQPPTRPSSSARAEMVTWAICWAALKAIDSLPE